MLIGIQLFLLNISFENVDLAESIIPIMFLVGGALLGFGWVIVTTIAKKNKIRQYEKQKRERIKQLNKAKNEASIGEVGDVRLKSIDQINSDKINQPQRIVFDEAPDTMSPSYMQNMSKPVEQPVTQRPTPTPTPTPSVTQRPMPTSTLTPVSTPGMSSVQGPMVNQSLPSAQRQASPMPQTSAPVPGINSTMTVQQKTMTSQTFNPSSKIAPGVIASSNVNIPIQKEEKVDNILDIVRSAREQVENKKRDELMQDSKPVHTEEKKKISSEDIMKKLREDNVIKNQVQTQTQITNKSVSSNMTSENKNNNISSNTNNVNNTNINSSVNNDSKQQVNNSNNQIKNNNSINKTNERTSANLNTNTNTNSNVNSRNNNNNINTKANNSNTPMDKEILEKQRQKEKLNAELEAKKKELELLEQKRKELEALRNKMYSEPVQQDTNTNAKINITKEQNVNLKKNDENREERHKNSITYEVGKKVSLKDMGSSNDKNTNKKENVQNSQSIQTSQGNHSKQNVKVDLKQGKIMDEKSITRDTKDFQNESNEVSERELLERVKEKLAKEIEQRKKEEEEKRREEEMKRFSEERLEKQMQREREKELKKNNEIQKEKEVLDQIQNLFSVISDDDIINDNSPRINENKKVKQINSQPKKEESSIKEEIVKPQKIQKPINKNYKIDKNIPLTKFAEKDDVEELKKIAEAESHVKEIDMENEKVKTLLNKIENNTKEIKIVSNTNIRKIADFRKVIAVISPENCGKTTIATNLAYELANRGVSTTLIDTDNVKKDINYYINKNKIGCLSRLNEYDEGNDLYNLGIKLRENLTVFTESKGVEFEINYPKLYQLINYAHEKDDAVIIDIKSGLGQEKIKELLKMSNSIMLVLDKRTTSYSRLASNFSRVKGGFVNKEVNVVINMDAGQRNANKSSIRGMLKRLEYHENGQRKVYGIDVNEIFFVPYDMQSIMNGLLEQLPAITVKDNKLISDIKKIALYYFSK